MISLFDLLLARGFSTTLSTKIIKHKDPRLDLAWLHRNHRPLFDAYQADQSKDVFNCDQIISCVQNEYGVMLLGIYRVEGKACGSRHILLRALNERCLPGHSLLDDKPIDGGFVYTLAEQPGFDDLTERVVLDWGLSDRAWHQWFSKDRDKEVLEILPRGYVMEWPGFIDVLIGWSDLRRIMQNPEANRHWIQPLSSVSGVYLIQHVPSGELYIGSATGDRGIWGRWEVYADNGHGGNVLLQKRIHDNPAWAADLRYSILHVLPRSTGAQDALRYERLHKEKLGSRAFGLNAN